MGHCSPRLRRGVGWCAGRTGTRPQYSWYAYRFCLLGREGGKHHIDVVKGSAVTLLVGDAVFLRCDHPLGELDQNPMMVLQWGFETSILWAFVSVVGLLGAAMVGDRWSGTRWGRSNTSCYVQNCFGRSYVNFSYKEEVVGERGKNYQKREKGEYVCFYLCMFKSHLNLSICRARLIYGRLHDIRINYLNQNTLAHNMLFSSSSSLV